MVGKNRRNSYRSSIRRTGGTSNDVSPLRQKIGLMPARAINYEREAKRQAKNLQAWKTFIDEEVNARR